MRCKEWNSQSTISIFKQMLKVHICLKRNLLNLLRNLFTFVAMRRFVPILENSDVTILRLKLWVMSKNPSKMVFGERQRIY